MKKKIECGVILPTWPKMTAVLKLEGESKLTVIEFDELLDGNPIKEGTVDGPHPHDGSAPIGREL